MTLTRRTIVKPGYDCRNAPCQHEPKGDHGIHCDEWHYVVSDGGEHAVSLTVFTGSYPPTANVTGLPERLLRPWATDLSFHSVTPWYEGQDRRESCAWLGERPGYCDGSGLRAEAVYAMVGRRDGASPEQSEAFWVALEDELRGNLADIEQKP